MTEVPLGPTSVPPRSHPGPTAWAILPSLCRHRVCSATRTLAGPILGARIRLLPHLPCTALPLPSPHSLSHPPPIPVQPPPSLRLPRYPHSLCARSHPTPHTLHPTPYTPHLMAGAPPGGGAQGAQGGVRRGGAHPRQRRAGVRRRHALPRHRRGGRAARGGARQAARGAPPSPRLCPLSSSLPAPVPLPARSLPASCTLSARSLHALCGKISDSDGVFSAFCALPARSLLRGLFQPSPV